MAGSPQWLACSDWNTVTLSSIVKGLQQIDTQHTFDGGMKYLVTIHLYIPVLLSGDESIPCKLVTMEGHPSHPCSAQHTHNFGLLPLIGHAGR